MGVNEGKGSYLGLPYLVGRSKWEVFAFVRERVWKKAHGWKEKLLSRAGKEIMIKSILQAIPTYVMSVFALPSTLCAEITLILRKFWWCSDGKDKGIMWKKWHDMCRQKKGGMGFRDVELFNLAFLAKQG